MDINPKALYNITAAASLLGIKPFHCHELVIKGKFPNAKKEQLGKTKTQRWMIPGQDIIDRQNTAKGGVGKRADGRNKFTTYLNPDELAKVTKFCEDNNIPAPVRANKPKADEEAAEA